MQKLKFPDGFLWGGATASEQSEGNRSGMKGQTIWDKHFEEEPNRFNDLVGPQITTDFETHFKTDLKLFKDIGANSIRLSFSWARLFPNNSKDLNSKGVKFYHDLLDEADKNNIKVIMTLFHFDMPLWAMEKGGWENKKVIDDFANYANFIFQEYGDKVYKYVTMNEPIVPIYGGYLYKFHWPLIEDEKRAFQASFGTILAHAKAVNIFNSKYKSKLSAEIGVVINFANTYAKNGIDFNEDDLKAAKLKDAIHAYSFLDSMIKGEFPEELKDFLNKNEELRPKYSNDELAEISKVHLDFVGVNFYGPDRVQAPKRGYKPKYKFEKMAMGYKWEKAVMNVFRGWEIYPKALYDISMIIMDRYNNLPFYISENGMGVQDEYKYKDSKTGIIQDDYRIAFLNEHLYWVHKAIANGAKIFGYHMWAIFDCWSWLNGYKNRYGFIEVDLKTQKRIPKKSAEWLRDASKNNAIDGKFKTVQEVMDLNTVDYKKSI